MAADKGSGAGGSASAEIGKYLDILAKDPDSRVFAPLAEAYRKAGLLDDAIETAREGLSVHPNYLGGRVALGRALFEKKSYAEAAEELRKVVKAAADNIIAHKVLGQIALAQGSLPDAEKSFRMVVMLDPHDKEAKQALADIGAGGPAPAAPAAAPAAPAEPAALGVAPAAAAVPPPAAEKSWGEVSFEGAPALQGIELHRAPADTAPAAAPPEPFPMEDIAVGPSAIELEEPDEFSEPLPDIDIPPADIVGETTSPATELSPFGLDVFQPIDLPAVEIPEQPATSNPETEPVAEFEVFGREPAGLSLPVAVAGAGDATPPESPATETPAEDESPFEIFGRPRRGGPPASAKGEREAYAEIEIEPTGHAAAAGGPAADQESVFEIFTREPRVEGPVAHRSGSAGRPDFEQIEVEPTAYVPAEPPEGELPVIELREEIPRIDVQSELELALEMERAPADAVVMDTAAEEPVAPVPLWQGGSEGVSEPGSGTSIPAAGLSAEGEEIGWEEESPWQAEPAAAEDDAAPLLTPEEAATEELVWGAPPEPAPTPEPGLEPALQAVEVREPVAEPLPEPANEITFEPSAEPVVEPAGEETAEGAAPAWVPPAEEILTLEEEIPSVDLAGEVLPEPEPVAAVEPVESAETAAPAAGRGVFDTETLASIYINQGFYGRAAAIYERLAAASPEDDGLRRRLEEVRGLERANAGAAAAGPAAPETTPAGRDRAETIRRLEALLAAFRGVRPR